MCIYEDARKYIINRSGLCGELKTYWITYVNLEERAHTGLVRGDELREITTEEVELAELIGLFSDGKAPRVHSMIRAILTGECAIEV